MSIMKIDPQILSMVHTESVNQHIDCIVYANNFSVAKAFLLKRGYSIEEYPFISAFGLNVKRDNIKSLAELHAIKYITTNSKVSMLVNVSHDVMKSPHILGWGDYPFVCAVIDTGVQPHIDLSFPYNQIINSVDFINGKELSYDDNGHGSFVAGVLSSKGVVSGGKYAGIAPGINIISLKALDHNGEAGAFSILKAMQWVYDNKSKYNIKVVCMSFGSSPVGKNDPLMLGADVLWDNGIVVVSAAGNSGPERETIKSPGSSTKIITVGAIDDRRETDEEYTIAEFSSRGPIYGNYKPDLVAPGVNIVGSSNYAVHKSFYGSMSGTSVATPMVAGICCNLLKENKKLSPNQIKQLLISSCEPITHNRNDEGFGLINYEKLLQMIR